MGERVGRRPSAATRAQDRRTIRNVNDHVYYRTLYGCQDQDLVLVPEVLRCATTCGNSKWHCRAAAACTRTSCVVAAWQAAGERALPRPERDAAAGAGRPSSVRPGAAAHGAREAAALPERGRRWRLAATGAAEVAHPRRGSGGGELQHQRGLVLLSPRMLNTRGGLVF